MAEEEIYKNTLEGIQNNVTKGDLDLKTFRGKNEGDSVRYIDNLYEYAYPSQPTGSSLRELIDKDFRKSETAEKKRTSYKCLSKIKEQLEYVKDVRGKKGTRLNLGIEICEDLQKAFKNAANVSKSDSFLSNPVVKNFMKKQSGVLKISIPRIKIARMKGSINPIKRLLASSKLTSSKTKKAQKREAKYLLRNIDNRNAKFKLFESSNNSNDKIALCYNYLKEAAEIAKRLSVILSSGLEDGTSQGLETTYLANIKKACDDLVKTWRQPSSKESPWRVFSYLDLLQEAFSGASNPSKPEYTPLLNDKNVKDHMSNQASVLSNSMKEIRKELKGIIPPRFM